MYVPIAMAVIWLVLAIMAFIMSRRNHQGGTDLMIRVIYPDGSEGSVRESRLAKLISQGKVVAYQPVEDWVELRRKITDVYGGVERRVNTLHCEYHHAAQIPKGLLVDEEGNG